MAKTMSSLGKSVKAKDTDHHCVETSELSPTPTPRTPSPQAWCFHQVGFQVYFIDLQRPCHPVS